MKKYIQLRIHMVIKELIEFFGLTKKEAKRLVYDEINFWNVLFHNPLGLHDSPHQWCLALMTLRYKKYKKKLDWYYFGVK